jgi:hypothetical protein
MRPFLLLLSLGPLSLYASAFPVRVVVGDRVVWPLWWVVRGWRR